MTSRLNTMKESSVRVNLTLPRVVAYRGKVGHILISGSNIASLRSKITHRLDEVACHSLDSSWLDEGVSWAGPDTPTCSRCLRAMGFLEVEIVQ